MSDFQSDSIASLAAALAKAQTKLSAVARNREVSVEMRSGGRYSFKYATFDAIIEHVREALTANGLWFIQTLRPVPSNAEFHEGRDVLLRTTLVHASGEWMASELLVPDNSTNQEFGSALTYRKRYALAGLLGVGSEEDDDGNAGDGNIAQTKSEKPTRKQAEKAGAAAQDDSATKAAVAFGNKVLELLPTFQTAVEYATWDNKDVRGKIAKLVGYDKELHQRVIDLCHETNQRLAPR